MIISLFKWAFTQPDNFAPATTKICLELQGHMNIHAPSSTLDTALETKINNILCAFRDPYTIVVSYLQKQGQRTSERPIPSEWEAHSDTFICRRTQDILRRHNILRLCLHTDKKIQQTGCSQTIEKKNCPKTTIRAKNEHLKQALPHGHYNHPFKIQSSGAETL